MSMRRMAFSLAFTAALAATLFALGSDGIKTPNTRSLKDGEKSPPGKLSELSWLVGHWIGEGLGGTVEEAWTPPMGGSMMGLFRLVRDEKLVFSEILFITEEDASLVLRLKHFDADFKGWEEKDVSVDFKLVKLGPDEAYFDGLTMRRLSDGTLQSFVAIKKKDGEISEAEFRYRPQK